MLEQKKYTRGPQLCCRVVLDAVSFIMCGFWLPQNQRNKTSLKSNITYAISFHMLFFLLAILGVTRNRLRVFVYRLNFIFSTCCIHVASSLDTYRKSIRLHTTCVAIYKAHSKPSKMHNGTWYTSHLCAMIN